MEDDIFAQTTYGKLALEKIKPTDPNFRLYCAGWLGENGESDVMQVAGCVFRKAMAGKRKGELCIMVPGTGRTVYVTAEEMQSFDKGAAPKPSMVAAKHTPPRVGPPDQKPAP